MRGLLRKKVTWIALAFVTVAAIVGLWAFQPWKLFTRSEVDEALPAEFAGLGATTSEVTTGPPTTTAPATTTEAPETTTEAPVTTTAAAKPAPTVLAEGEFVTQEHQTRGTARVLESGGARILRLEGFSTSDGPDLHIWLSDATAGGEWGKYDDGRYVSLGAMKATDGNQNYAIPADADLSGLRSVVVWCDRFNVAFGSAPLDL